MYGKTRWAACLIAVFAASQGFAAPALLLSPAQYDPALILPPPPDDDSARAKAELGELQRITGARTEPELARAKSDDKTENASIFADAIGPWFELKQLPATAKMLVDVRREEQAAAAVAKDFFKRNRPWIVDSTMASCSRADAPNSSYPSGHSTMGYAMGTMLATLVPDKAQAILARASEYAENRLVCGMHFRRDIEAGQTLGTVVAVELMQTSAFRAEYDAAAKELQSAHLAGR